MIELFDIEGGKVAPTKHCYTIKILKDIMDTHPDDYLSIYAYLFYMSCLNEEKNPFTNVPEDDKEELILREVGGNFSPDEVEIAEALKFTRTLYATTSYNLFLAAKVMTERISHYMKTAVVTDGKDGNLLAIKSYLKDMQEIIQNYKGVYKEFMEEQSTQTRGGNQLAYDQT